MSVAGHVTIRQAEAGDVEELADFNVTLAHETEGRLLDRATVREGVAAAVSDPSKGRYFVAVSDGRVVGCLMVTHEWSDWRNGDLWWIQSVFVVPSWRGRGVFRRLYGHTRAAARAADARGLRLYVERDNRPAKATYARLGMVDAGYELLEDIF